MDEPDESDDHTSEEGAVSNDDEVVEDTVARHGYGVS
jgi:hypothetical protein